MGGPGSGRRPGSGKRKSGEVRNPYAYKATTRKIRDMGREQRLIYKANRAYHSKRGK